MSNVSASRSTTAGVVFYIAMLAFGLALVVAVQYAARNLGFEDSVKVARLHTSHGTLNVTLHVLFTLATVIICGSIAGYLCKYIGQPPVIGEVLAGIALGPSLLGAISPQAMELLIPSVSIDKNASVATSIKVVAQLGVILYMFLVGLKLSPTQLKNRLHSAVAISHASIVVPFALGSALSLWLYPTLAGEDVSFFVFSLFVAVAMSITAFPVLARILTDRKLDKTQLGAIAISCAAADDVTAWCILALIVGIAKSQMSSAGLAVAGAIGFILVMTIAIRPLLVSYTDKLDRREGPLPNSAVATFYVLVLASASFTEWIGIHAIFGGFFLGLIVPSESKVAKDFTSKLYDPVTILLLPAFFAYTGMRTQIGLLHEPSHWMICMLIVFVATLGKFGGTILAARFTGETWRHASALGLLMNTRGLMELIVLNIGLDLGILSPTLFAMMVIMALVTTVVTSPLLQLLIPAERMGATDSE